MLQFRRPTAYLKPLLNSFVTFTREKTTKEIKNITNQRTFRPAVPGRAVMALLRNLRPANIQKVVLEKTTMVVTIAEPSFLDSLFGRQMSEYDFRSEGYGVVKIHGPVLFKWEMCVSEEGYGPVEGILSVTVGGWTSLDRFGTGVIKTCFEPQQAKKRGTSGGGGRSRNRLEEGALLGRDINQGDVEALNHVAIIEASTKSDSLERSQKRSRSGSSGSSLLESRQPST